MQPNNWKLDQWANYGESFTWSHAALQSLSKQQLITFQAPNLVLNHLIILCRFKINKLIQVKVTQWKNDSSAALKVF